MSKKNSHRAFYNLILFTLSFIYIFVIGLFDSVADMNFVYYTVISAIILVSIFTIRKQKSLWVSIPAIIVILTWVTEILDFPILSKVTGYASTLFFLVVIIMLILRVASSKKVGTLEFLESINVYFLLGIAGSILFGVVYSFDHTAYNPPGAILTTQADFIYYSFVTMTTLGYGDITPVDAVARSLSIFFSVAGQLYLTMIIAMLVGKYLSQDPTDDEAEVE